MIAASIRSGLVESTHEWSAVMASQDGIVRTWGDAYGYAMVATGRAEAMVDPIVSIWDVAPISVVIGEAGGTFTDMAGRDRIDSGHGVGTNGRIHSALLDELAAQGTPTGTAS